MECKLIRLSQKELGGKIEKVEKRGEIMGGRIPYGPLPDNLHFMRS